MSRSHATRPLPAVFAAALLFWPAMLAAQTRAVIESPIAPPTRDVKPLSIEPQPTDESVAGDNPIRTALETAATELSRGDNRRALLTLEPVEAAEPHNPWLGFYRGTALMRINEPYRAMEQFDRALATLTELGDPDPQLADMLRHQRQAARRQVFGLTWQTGLAYDSNVTFIGPGATEFGLIAGRGDGKFANRFQLDYAPVVDEFQTLAVSFRTGQVWQFAIEQFNFQDYGTTLQYVRRIGERLEAAIRYDYDVSLLNNQMFLSNHVLTPSLTWRYAPLDWPVRPDFTKVMYFLDTRDYLFETTPDLDQDGVINGVAVEQGVRFEPIPSVAWTWDLTLGYRFSPTPTEGEEFDREVQDFYLGLQVPLPSPLFPGKDLTFRWNALWEFASYGNPSIYSGDNDRRRDSLFGMGFVLSQKLIEHPDYGDLTLHGIINWSDAESNITTRQWERPFSYDKGVYGVQLEWSF